MELREEEGVEPPIGREEDKRWVVAEPGWQKGSQDSGTTEESGVGKHRGGVRTTAVRTLEAGAFKMEVWVEEGKGKFEATVEEGADESDEEGILGALGEEEL